MNQNDYGEILKSLIAIAVHQNIINDDLRAMLKHQNARLDNHAEQIERLIKIEDKLTTLVEQAIKPNENGR